MIFFYFDFLLNYIYRVRKFLRVIEKLSKIMLNGVGVVSGLVMVFIVKLKLGKVFFLMVLGEVFLVLVDVFSKLNY